MGIEVLIGVVIGAVYVEDSEVWLFGGAGCMWRAKMRSLYVRMFGGWVRAGCLSVCLT
jgi:cation transport regulator ChaC